MTTQDTQAVQPQSKEEQAVKLRRVLSVKDPAPAPAPSKPSAAQPKPVTR